MLEVYHAAFVTSAPSQSSSDTDDTQSSAFHFAINNMATAYGENFTRVKFCNCRKPPILHKMWHCKLFSQAMWFSSCEDVEVTKKRVTKHWNLPWNISNNISILEHSNRERNVISIYVFLIEMATPNMLIYMISMNNILDCWQDSNYTTLGITHCGRKKLEKIYSEANID